MPPIMRVALAYLPVSLLALLLLRACASGSTLLCSRVAEEALRALQPRFPIELKARAKAGADTGGLEASSGAWVVLEVPLYSKKERLNTLNLMLRRKKEILRAIAKLQTALRRLRFISEMKKYRRERAEHGFEDWERYLGLLEAEEQALGDLNEARAVLAAYAIPEEKARTCLLGDGVSPHPD